MKKILITGGNGLVGVATKASFIKSGYKVYSPTSKEVDLTIKKQFDELLNDINPDGIIHLAAKVGGVKSNSNQLYDYYKTNHLINENVIDCSIKNKTKKIVSLLSTCVYPDSGYVRYPLTEEQLHLGPPHDSNFGYAYAKRMVDVMSRSARIQHGCNFVTAIPNNIFGENDNFDLEHSHVVPALIRKIYEAKLNNQNSVEVWGDGSPLREFTYSKDIGQLLLWVYENYNEETPINIGNTNEISIKNLVENLVNIIDYKGNIIYNSSKLSGQFRKPSSNQKLRKLGCDFEYTEINQALRKTCEWFDGHYPNIRGI